MDNNTIFKDFNTISAKAWKQKIQVDLKGADYNKTLLTNTLEGITIQPFYHKDTFKKLQPSFNKRPSIISQSFFIDNAVIVNKLSLDVLSKGAKALFFKADSPFDFKTLFLNLPKEAHYIIQLNFLDKTFIKELSSFLIDYDVIISTDIIYHFEKEGNWFFNQQKDFEIIKLLNKKPHFYVGINAGLYQNAGANIVQQIAYTLAHANEYLNVLEQDQNNLKTTFLFTFAIGSNYFFEIAKIKAFKYLFNKLSKEYNLIIDFKIVLEPTLRNKTLYDYNVNLLRTTTESMTALLSNVDFILNTPYDAIYHKSNEFGSRIARNQLLVLKEESYFNNETDITKGAYYIEQISYELAEKSLNLFKDLEKTGGLLSQLFTGTIQRKIEENAVKEQLKFNNGELVLLGTNKYPNNNDKMKNEIEIYPFIKSKPRKTLIKPIIAKRLAEKLEKERLDLE